MARSDEIEREAQLLAQLAEMFEGEALDSAVRARAATTTTPEIDAESVRKEFQSSSPDDSAGEAPEGVEHLVKTILDVLDPKRLESFRDGICRREVERARWCLAREWMNRLLDALAVAPEHVVKLDRKKCLFPSRPAGVSGEAWARFEREQDAFLRAALRELDPSQTEVRDFFRAYERTFALRIEESGTLPLPRGFEAYLEGDVIWVGRIGARQPANAKVPAGRPLARV